MTAPLCACGCGKPTSAAVKNYRQRGIMKGDYFRFVLGHNFKNRPVGNNRLDYEVDLVTGCWNWNGSTHQGYGQIRVTERSGVAETIGAHRYFYERQRGPIPPGLHLHHTCRNRLCVNPDHLEPVERGEHCRLAGKLSMSKARAIRELGAAGTPQTVIARQFDVNPRTVRDVLLGKTWQEDPLTQALAVSFGGSE